MPVKAASKKNETTADIKSIPVTTIKGVGPKIADRLVKLHIHSVQDALFHFPFRYQDRTNIIPVGSLVSGQECAVFADIELTEVVFRGRRNLICRVTDGTGYLSLRFFHFSSLQQQRLKRGCKIYAYGEVRSGTNGLEMIHPEYEVLSADSERLADEQLTPVYHTTEGVHQISMRNIVGGALDHYLEKVTDWLPCNVLSDNNYPSLQEAIEGLHRPAPEIDTEKLLSGFHPYQQRLAFEELLAHQLSLRLSRKRTRKDKATALEINGHVYRKLLTGLPFELTGAQKRVINQLCEDVSTDVPMQRLCQGDVGSGKTIIAAAAAAIAVDSGRQVAIMAPTGLLSDQHLTNFVNWFEPLGVRVVGLTGSNKGKQRNRILTEIEGGEASIVVGTHALFQRDVVFKDLALIVVDEQHRFGVAQRLALKEKAGTGRPQPHQLIMTATPIPRTLAQTLYADLDVSVIDELPPGRQPVQTVVIPESRRAEIVERVNKACHEKRQVYWVCPLIEESESVDWQAAIEVESGLKEALSGLNIGLVHGRMKSADKESVMRTFKAGNLDLLVATTVIEVGVDVPNANLMVIENSERLGLSQLHQLRGRVGRGTEESACILLYHSPLSRVARERLETMRTTNDGFVIAQKDMELRGPGEILGLRQAGAPEFQVADLWRDQKLLPSVQKTAELFELEYSDRIQPLINRWFSQADRYGNV